MVNKFHILLAFIFCISLNSQFSENYESLNGVWSQSCDSIICGRFKGELECSPEMWVQVSFALAKNEGTMIREDFIAREKDTSQIVMKKIAGELYMIGATCNKPWLRKVYELKDNKIGLYSHHNNFITFYIR